MESDRPREGSQNQDTFRYTRDPTKSAPRIPPGFENTEAARHVMDQPPTPVRSYGGNQDERYMWMGSEQSRPRTGASQGDRNTPSGSAHPTPNPASNYGDGAAKLFMQEMGPPPSMNQERRGVEQGGQNTSSSTTNSSLGLGDDDDDDVFNKFGPATRDAFPPLTYTQPGRDNTNVSLMIPGQPQGFANASGPSQLHVNNHRTAIVNINMNGEARASPRPPSSVYDLRGTRTFDRFGNVQSAFQRNREQPRGIPRMIQPRRQHFSPAESNNVGGSIAANVPTVGAQAPTTRASGIQGFPPAINPNNNTLHMMMGGYNGPMHGNFDSAQYKGHRQNSYGNNALMESTSYNAMVSANYGSFSNMSRTRGQNTGTANVVQGNRKVSDESHDSQPNPPTEEEKALERKTIELIQALRNQDEHDVYFAFYGLWTRHSDDIRKVLSIIENNLIRLGLFNTGPGGLFGYFPLLSRNPDFLEARHKLRLADWFRGVPVPNIRTPLQLATTAGQRSLKHLTYDTYISSVYGRSMALDHVPAESVKAESDDDRATNMTVRKSKDEFAPSYSKTGWRPKCNPVLLYQAYLAGIDLRTCMYKGSISQKMIRNALTPERQNCAVFIKAVNPLVTHEEIFSTFEDPIYSYYKKPPIRGKHDSCAVTATFMDRAAADRYMSKSKALGIYLGGEKMSVVWSRDKACAAEPYEIGQSRALKLRGPMTDAEFTVDFIVDFLLLKLDFELVWSREINDIEPGIRGIELHFQSIRGQSRAAKKCLERDYRDCGEHDITVDYAQDPCVANRRTILVGWPGFPASYSTPINFPAYPSI